MGRLETETGSPMNGEQQSVTDRRPGIDAPMPAGRAVYDYDMPLRSGYAYL
jgi:hypothetical protein